MPELPEVERGRRIAESVARGRKIVQVHCALDEIVYDGVPPSDFSAALRGKTVLEVRRRGKQLWFELERAPHPLFHFGMTGAFRVPDLADLPLASRPRPDANEAWPPRFTKIHLHFEDGGELVMTNARRLGRILLRERPEEELPISRLGFDPVLDGIGVDEFRERTARRKTSMKALLLDQSFVAGVGNWIADEVLYQARIDPHRKASELDPAELERVRRKLLSVIERAVAVDADKKSFPRGWLFHVRWGKNAEARTVDGKRVEFVQLGGRTTAWVPERQV